MELSVKAPDSGGSRSFVYKLETKNLSCKPCNNRNQNKDCKYIINDVNCEALPGEITAIAGSSGAGKTTLLEILAGNKRKSEYSGQVLLNNGPFDSKLFKRLSGFVSQNDAHFPLLTVQETLMYSALLRLPGARKGVAASRVKSVMNELEIDHIAGSRVGEGISGGERRRVSIGVELVHDPAVIFLDEPTSGLDSATAFLVLNLLKSMVIKQGKTVVLTIHQPGFRLLQLIDRLVLLSNERVMHNGSLHSLADKLERIPRGINVLEFAIEVMQFLDTRNSNSINNQRYQEIRSTVSDAYTDIYHERPHSYSNTVFNEVLILVKRFYTNIFRNKNLFATRTLHSLIAGTVLGTVFFEAGNKQGQVALQTQIGFFAFSLTFLLSSATEILPIFLQERAIIMRETSRGAYRVFSYVISNTIVFLPFLLIVSLLYSIPPYWLIGFRRDFDGCIYFCLVVWFVVLTSNSFVACFSALVPDFVMGTSVISAMMGSFFLFSGNFISKNNMPHYWVFMHYLSLFKYPFECFVLNEYGGDHNLHGTQFLRQQQLKGSQKWSNLAVMFCFIVGYRVLCLLVLWYKCSKQQ